MRVKHKILISKLEKIKSEEKMKLIVFMKEKKFLVKEKKENIILKDLNP